MRYRSILCTALAIQLLHAGFAAPSAAQTPPLTEVWNERYTALGNGFDMRGAYARDGRITVIGTEYSDGFNPHIVQFTSDGSIAWSVTESIPGAAFGSRVIMADDGSSYVIGDSSNSLLFLKYDTHGILLWSYFHTFGHNILARGIAIGPEHQVYAIARLSHEVGGSPIDSYLVVALDENGGYLWSDLYNGGGSDTPNAIAVDDEGRIFVTGHSDRPAGSGGLYEAATLAYSPDGTRLWEHRYRGPSASCWSSLGAQLSPDGHGGAFVAGFANCPESHDLIVLRYESNGEPAWVQTYAGLPNLATTARALERDAAGNLIVVGLTRTSSTVDDLVLLSFDVDGNPLWYTRHIDHPFWVGSVNDAAVATDGRVYVTGWGGEGRSDFVVAQYDPSGDYETHVTTGWTGPEAPCHDRSRMIAIDMTGAIYAAGESECGDLPTPDLGAYVVRFAGTSTSTEPELTTQLGSLHVYPNPSASSISIRYSPSITGYTQIRLYDTMGRRVATLFEGVGSVSSDIILTLDEGALKSGLYFVRAITNGNPTTKSLSIVR